MPLGRMPAQGLDAIAVSCESSGMRKLLAPLYVILGVTLATVALPTVAHAEHEIRTPYTGTRPFQLDIHGGILWYGYGLATGLRFGIPVMHNGFIDSIDNAVYVNFGADFYYVDDVYWADGNHHYGFAFGIPVTLHWEFYFSDMWSAFGELGFQVYFPPSLWDGNPRGGGYYVDAGAWIIGAVGGTLHFNEAIGLTLRIGNPYISLGLTFAF